MAKKTEIWRSLPEQWEPGTDIAMGAKIWQALPHDLLLKIFRMLPMRVLVATVERWAISRCSAKNWCKFVGALLPWIFGSVAVGHDTYGGNLGYRILRGDSSDTNIHKAPLPFNAVIVHVSRNIYCSHRKWYRSHLSIGTITTGARRDLPRPYGFEWWNFIAMDFNATTRHFIVLLGLNTITSPEPDGRKMVMQIYDSESHAWTMLRMRVPNFIYPSGKGIYSKGKVYWINSWDGTTRLLAFTIRDRRWTEIGLPKGGGFDYVNKRFELRGCDGRVVLMVYSYACLCTRMRRLKRGQGLRNGVNLILSGGQKALCFFRAEANSSGWKMVMNRELKISMCNPHRNVRSITLPSPLPSPSRVFVSAFESNNVSWP